MALTQQLSPASLSLLQLFMPTLTPLSPCHLKYPHLSWIPFHRDYTIWRKWINHQGVSKAHERVNSQGLPAFRRRPLTRLAAVGGCCTGLWKQKLVFAGPADSWDSAKDTIFYLRRFTPVRSCTSQMWKNLFKFGRKLNENKPLKHCWSRCNCLVLRRLHKHKR